MWVVAAMLKELLVPRGSKNATGIHYSNLVLRTVTSLLLLTTSTIDGFDIREYNLFYVASASDNTRTGSLKPSNI
jgi:hypothetical protein